MTEAKHFVLMLACTRVLGEKMVRLALLNRKLSIEVILGPIRETDTHNIAYTHVHVPLYVCRLLITV